MDMNKGTEERRRRRKPPKPDEDDEPSSGWVFILRLLSVFVVYLVYHFYLRFFSMEVSFQHVTFKNMRGCVLRGFSLQAEPC